MKYVKGIVQAGVLTGGAHLVQGLPGQDYAVCGSNSSAIWGVVSDGCSSGGRDVSLGSGAMALTALKALERGDYTDLVRSNPRAISGAMLLDLRRWLHLLGANNLMATAVMAKVQDSTLAVQMMGDGAFGLFHSDGSLSWFWGMYTDNTPGYLAYDFIMDTPESERRNTRAFQVNQYRKPLKGSAELVATGKPTPAWTFDTVAQDICGFVLCTDGIGTLDRTADIDAVLEVVARYGEEKSVNLALGQCGQTWLSRNRYPIDDLGMVIAHWG